MPDAPITLGRWKCPRCGHTLARVNIVQGEVEILCEGWKDRKKCGLINTWSLSHRIDIQPMR